MKMLAIWVVALVLSIGVVKYQEVLAENPPQPLGVHIYPPSTLCMWDEMMQCTTSI